MFNIILSQAYFILSSTTYKYTVKYNFTLTIDNIPIIATKHYIPIY